MDKLKTALDTSRGRDPWNGGDRLTLRALLRAQWVWYRARHDLASRRAGAWDANQLDDLAVIEWEIARREAGVADETVVEWLGPDRRRW